MKRIVLFLVCLSLTLPVLADATETPNGRLSALKDIDDYLTELAEQDEAASADAEDTAADLDEEGQRSYEELKAWADQHPEEFARMLADDEATYGPVEEDTAMEEGEEGESELTDPGSYCPDPNSDIFTWEAKAKKKKGKRSRRKGNRCTAAALKTNISTCCLLFVRTKLGLPANPRSVHARDYGSVLSSHGYCTFKGTPQAAPVGAVLVYSGGASGHIELKRGANSYWWGPTNAGPATTWANTKRYLKAIYIKCGGKKKK
jgi:hypothetical protein